MKPEEKAEELIDKFIPHTRVYNDEFGWENDIDSAKQCASIAVDEIIKYSPNRPIEEYDPIQYFREVKKEIEKL